MDSDHSIAMDIVFFDYKNWDYYVALEPGEMLMFREWAWQVKLLKIIEIELLKRQEGNW